MAFASTITKIDRFLGGRNGYKFAYGTFTNGAADAGGSITTGLKLVNDFAINFTSHVGTEVPKASASAGSITIVTSEGADGTWHAWGY